MPPKAQKKASTPKAELPAYPIIKVISFVSRSISSGKRRAYDLEGISHGPDQFQVTINGQTIYLQRAGVDAMISLLTDLTTGTEVKIPVDQEEAPKGPPEDPPEEPPQDPPSE